MSQKYENFTSVASTWYVEDSKIDFKNENTAHGNRLLLFYKSKIIEIEKDEYFPDNCKKYSHCSTNSKPNSAYCSSTNSHCVKLIVLVLLPVQEFVPLFSLY